MKLIVGLGNPGEKYAMTRHNVGFMLIDKLARFLTKDEWHDEEKFRAQMIKTDKAMLAKPQTFMNESGRSVSSIVNFYKIAADDIYVIHDDLDILLGEYKIQKGKGPLVHKGIKSIERDLGKPDFWRVRIGVENRKVKGNTGVPGEKYSLTNFSGEERLRLDQVIGSVVEKLLDII